MDTKRRKTMFVRVDVMVIVAVAFSMMGSAFAQGGNPTGYHDGMEGVVDAAGCTAFGWVSDPDDPGRDLQVQILADGNLVATTVADLLRPDVGECLDGTCGFNVNLWGLISAGEEHQIAVQAYDDETQIWVNLSGTPKSLTCWGYPEGSHDGGEGVVDQYSCNASGWAADPDDRDRDLQVQIFSDGDWVAETTANLDRPDVGACTGGTCGFYADLWGLISPDEEHQITTEVYDVESGTWQSLGAAGKLLTCQTPPPPIPRFDIRANTDRVEGWDWAVDETVTLEIDDPNTPESPDYSGTQVAFIPEGWETTLVEFDLTGAYDIKPDDEASLSNGTITKTTTVTELAITNIDVDADIVSGVAAPGSHIDLWASTPPDWPNYYRHVTADEYGNWSADFGQFGDEGDEQNAVDIVGDVWIDSQQPELDEGNDGDKTMFGLTIPPPPPVPFIWADPLCECINGWDWDVGDTITVEVFDHNGNELELQNPTQVYTAESGAFFELGPEGINLQPGYRITMTDGLTFKEMVITSLVVKEMNPVANTISGVYDPTLELVIYAGGQSPLSLTFDGDRWVATFDASIDVFGEAYQPDEDGDKTGMGWDGVPRFMRYDLYAFDVESETNKRMTTLDGTGEYDPSWSPFGKKVAHDVVYWDGSQAIYITDVATGSSHPLKGAVDGGNDAAWSPNGLWIAFDRRWTGDQSIYVVPFTGGQRRLVRENGVSPNWSPNGLRIVFQDLADGGKVKTVGLLGNLVVTIADYGENPAWSPDGKWIAYSRDGDIWKVRVGPLGTPYGDPILVADMAAWIGLPTWSDDSTTIAFDAGMTDDWDLWSVPAAGGEPTWLTGVPEFGDYGPDYWRGFVAYAGYTP